MVLYEFVLGIMSTESEDQQSLTPPDFRRGISTEVIGLPTKLT